MKKAKLLFWDTSLNKYSVNALLGALENTCELLDVIDIGFFTKPSDIYMDIDNLKKYEIIIAVCPKKTRVTNKKVVSKIKKLC